MSETPDGWPTLTLPDAESEVLRKYYAQAQVILEYGSGGSTVLAARQPGKLIFSVESDRSWGLRLQRKFDEAELPSDPILYHADIGITGAWGRPINDNLWRGFYRYPLAIWAETFFRQPDLVFIDGRLRPACFVAACINTRAPITVLFDDYDNRPSYKVVEDLIEPTEIVGRMALFHVTPRQWPVYTSVLLAELCTKMSYSSNELEPADYGRICSEVRSHTRST